MTGSINSIQTFGTLDGPGLRTVVFFQGCPNRCRFCHNVDVAIRNGGVQYTVDKLVDEVLKGKEYWDNYDNPKAGEVKGGVTITGGEPLFQPEFLLEFVKKLKEKDVHVAVDTSATTDFSNIEKLSDYVDLWMISVKHMDTLKHKELVGRGNEEIFSNILGLNKLLEKKEGKSIRIRFVIIPTITDSDEHLEKLGQFIKQITMLEKVELLPYSSIGRDKWIQLFGEYEMDGIREGNEEDVQRVKKILSKYVTRFVNE